MIGKKIYKDKMDRYAEYAIWCNNNGATIEDKGDYYEIVEIPGPTLEETKEKVLEILKAARDAEEVEPITYKNNSFDYDDKARDRINAAIIALDGTGMTLSWTTANNTEATVSAEDLKNVVRAVAVRSNELHVKYRTKKEEVEKATTEVEVNSITWD